jgi:phage shock protein A
MLTLLRRSWNYMTAFFTNKFNEGKDPKIELEQALQEAQTQHRHLKEQAAVVIGNQKQTQLQMDRKMDELEKANSSARQAVLMADDATRKGDPAKAAEYTRAAESFANRLIALESEVEGLKNLNLQATQASDQAKAAVQSSSSQLQKKLAERQKLLSTLDQAKMQESMNKTMASLTETVGGDVPSLDEVRAKIEARHARAQGAAELQGSTVESRMLEVEQASLNTEAQARLSQIKAQLGLGGETATAPAPTGMPEASTPQPGTPQPGTAQPG